MNAEKHETSSVESPFRWRREGGDVVAEYPGMFTLRASADGALKSLEVAAHLQGHAAEKLRHGFAAAFLRSLRGGHSLHASAVATKRGALLCLGSSGSGKSTIAESLCRHAGADLLADDIAAIEKVDASWNAVPSESAHWLAKEDARAKTRVPGARLARGPSPVRWIAALRFDDERSGDATVPRVRPLTRADGVAALLAASLRFELTRDVWIGELDALSALARGAVIFEVSRSPAVTPKAVAEAILATMAQAP